MYIIGQTNDLDVPFPIALTALDSTPKYPIAFAAFENNHSEKIVQLDSEMLENKMFLSRTDE